jgi:protein-S-isoprenylcysteine O-methyltransferase
VYLAFLINQSRKYVIAGITSWVEFWFEYYLFPGMKSTGLIAVIGATLVIMGQFFRTSAMVNAASNFSHMIESEKRADHKLVTTGVYRYFAIVYQCLLLRA